MYIIEPIINIQNGNFSQSETKQAVLVQVT